MSVLALELSSAVGSVAWRGADNTVGREWPNNRKDSAPFFREVGDLRRNFGLPNTILVGLGPGSYAGTRIAASTAVGLAAGAAKIDGDTGSAISLIGYPSICAMACDEEEYCVVGDARRQSFFFARVNHNDLAEGPVLMSEEDLRRAVLAIPASVPILSSERLPGIDRVRLCYPSAKVLARLSNDLSHAFIAPPLEPLYLREPHITIPKSGRANIPVERTGS